MNIEQDFELIRHLSSAENVGANNAGISLVRQISTGALCIEKRLNPVDIARGSAQREIEILSQLRNHPTGNISHMLAFKIDDGSRPGSEDIVVEPSASVYLEYCDSGSLEDLIARYMEANEAFPEAFLWHLIAGLAEAVQYCQYGPASSSASSSNPMEQDDGPIPWDTVYHCDLEPSNVLLDSSQIINIKTPYPRIVLCDFGISTTREDIMYGCSECVSHHSWSRKNDVHQIGLVMACCILSCYRLDPDSMMNEVYMTPGYSWALKSLVFACLEHEDEERIEIEYLVEKIARARARLRLRMSGEIAEEALLC
ncbi:kinase-like protein [Pleomassaria siparia CBS 279.74]|uniref:non-specific serine/threonine protein kinase n=1 Tax=Pleomassaria siparia CBS 279.74 TaxID=1314801 RepID=A0A6G1KEA0_9PLEO|nr:kinase-like protein [Pleomassaria siparia CBS 279.74]